MISVKRIEDYWYSDNKLAKSLRPLSWLFCALVHLRKLLYILRALRSYRNELPVIVVGNITVGGSGKTPMVIWLARLLKQQGYKPGIISRGYGGSASRWPQQVRPDSDPYVVGDEPVLIARRTECPMAVGPDRVEDIHALKQFTDCDVIISDDGMQHYRMRRDMEIVVIDGTRRFGNGYCLPAGPLREPVSRLRRVDFVVNNSGVVEEGEIAMDMAGGVIKRLDGAGDFESLTEWKGKQVHALCGIGNPHRFFDVLRKNGLDVIAHSFPDHHRFSREDISFDDALPVIMTEKDAVKCARYANERHWYYPVDAVLDDGFAEQVITRLKEKIDG
ncbi:MAG: tetraacyldisaccharide 4'-kinase [Gammaproteobacteria bacterium]|nr:tetraacyldisaccharide 4'-kinase [Gammaproteobacteria bacterium]